MAAPADLFLTPPPTGGQPRLLTAWAFENAWKVARSKSAQSSYWFDMAVAADGGPARMNANGFDFQITASQPNVYIPYAAEGASVAKFYELSNMVIAQLAMLYDGYMSKYFPDETGYLLRAQEWICNTIQYGGTGISPVVERQIWDRERSRTLSELARNEADAYTLWAGRGFPLPPGMLANQLSMIRLDAAGKIAQASRDMAIKQMEIEIENVKFAVSEAIKLYGSAVGAAGDYLKALSIGPTSAMQVIPSITDSQSRLISAATDSYRASISVDELRLKASMTPAQWEQEARIKNGDWLTQQIKIEVDAAIAAAQSVGTQAAAALNGLHANTGVTNGTQDSVSYNYSNDTIDAAPTIITVV